MKVNKSIIFIAIIILVAVLSYSNTFNNNFVFDDYYFIVNNVQIRQPELSSFEQPSTGNLYRPLRSLFTAMVFSFAGSEPFGYHLHNLILHTFISITIFFITWRLAKNRIIAFITTVLFAAHPIHTERITNMTAGFDLYGILFMLLSFYCYILYRERSRPLFLWCAFASFALGLFSSE